MPTVTAHGFPLEVPTSLRLHVELVYDPDCPNVDKARDVLAAALRDVGVAAVWTEWSTGDEGCPSSMRGFGSPTVLVNGEDVAPGPHPWVAHDPAKGPRCRVYRSGDELLGMPPHERVATAVRRALGPEVG